MKNIINISNVNLYFLLFYFVIFSFLGWTMETIRVSIKSGRFVNRGFANGPYCPIYGVGMCFVIVFLDGLKGNIPLLFLFGIIVTTALEYFTAYLLEIIFKAKWWDYSYKKYNLHGRICLDISIAWGILSVIMIEWIVPIIDIFINMIPVVAGKIFIYIVMVIMLVDVITTVQSILSFKEMLYRLAQIKSEIKVEWNKFSDKFPDNLREYIDIDELTEKIAEVNIKTRDIKQKLSEKKQLIKDITLDEIKAKFKDKEFSEEKLAAINKLRNMNARFVAITKVHISKNHRRILRAYPDFKIKNDEFQEILKNIKDNFKRKP